MFLRLLRVRQAIPVKSSPKLPNTMDQFDEHLEKLVAMPEAERESFFGAFQSI